MADERQIPLSLVAHRAGQELSGLHQLALDMQGALSAVLAPPPRDGDTIRCLQAIDRITQSLDDLSELMTYLASGIEPDRAGSVSALSQRIVLRELALRLLADPAGPPVPEPAERPDEIVWF